MSAIMNFINQYRELKSLDKIDKEVIEQFYERIIEYFHLNIEKEIINWEKHSPNLDKKGFWKITGAFSYMDHRNIIFDSLLLFIGKYMDGFRGKSEGEFFKYFYSVIKRFKEKEKNIRENEINTDEEGFKSLEEININKSNTDSQNPIKNIINTEFEDSFNDCVKNLPEELNTIIEKLKYSLLSDDKIIKKQELAAKIGTDSAGITRRFEKIRKLLTECLTLKGYSNEIAEMK